MTDKKQGGPKQMNRINHVIRGITEALVHADTRAEIEQGVCDRLIDSEPYRFAWIGEPTPETNEIEPRAWGGDEAHFLDEITVTVDESETGQGPTATAARTREIQVIQNVRENPDTKPWREQALEYGYQASAAIPLVYEDRLYGVLTLYAERPDAFDETERDLLAELGNTIPHAMNTVEEKERYRTFVEDVFKTSGVGVVILGPDLQVMWTNEAIERYFGIDADELIGQDIIEFIQNRLKHIFAKTDAFADALISSYEEETYREEYGGSESGLSRSQGEGELTFIDEFECHVLPDETRQDRWLHYRSQPIQSGRFAGGRLNLYYDITTRKRAEQDLADALEMSNAELERFAYIASHDLREPLRMVTSYLQLLERLYGDELDSDAQEFIDYAVDGADRMQAMVDGLLEYSRIDTDGGEFESTDMETVLDQAAANLDVAIEESDAEITSDSLPTVSGTETHLIQVFQNLIGNAIKYTDEEPPRIHVGAEKREDEWIFAVEDNGIGIDPDNADQIFEIFNRLHHTDENSGTGLGLALCKKVIRRHGGRIWVDSEPGEGATFSFTIPTTDDHS